MYSVDVQKSSYKSGQSRINDGSHFISWSSWVRCLRLQSRVVHELADILEVIHALSVDLGASPDSLDEICAEKYIERGGFEKGIMLLSTTEKE